MRTATEGAYHLAQVNVMRVIAPLDDLCMTEFLALLPSTNDLAEASAGFVWRFEDDDLSAGTRAYGDDRILLNLSVWESQEALWNFAYASQHLEVMRRRRSWTERLPEISMALWWVPPGREPTIEAAAERLDVIRAVGPSPAAFTFRRPFPPPSTTHHDTHAPLRSRPGQRSGTGDGRASERAALRAQPVAR